MILLVGKMASGKDTIKKELIKMGMKSVVTYTTRPKRKGETDGLSYNFIDKEEFLKKKKEDFFAETTSYNVANGDTWYYGSAVEDLTDEKVIIVNPQGLEKLKRIKELNPISFYISVDDNTILDRVKKRGDNEKEVKRRLVEDLPYFENIYENADFVFSNNIGVSPETIAKCILYTYKNVVGGVKS